MLLSRLTLNQTLALLNHVHLVSFFITLNKILTWFMRNTNVATAIKAALPNTRTVVVNGTVILNNQTEALWVDVLAHCIFF